MCPRKADLRARVVARCGVVITAAGVLVTAAASAASTASHRPHHVRAGAAVDGISAWFTPAGGGVVFAAQAAPRAADSVLRGAMVIRTTVGARQRGARSARNEAVLVSALAGDGIPATALRAYQRAAASANAADSHCHLPWPLLAGIGRVESDHGRFAGAVLLADGTSSRKIVGIALNGHRTELVLDTDGGRLDGDKVYDRAVGPMQFIPSTWALYRTDGNGDGRADPFNIFDAAETAGRYLCAAGGDLATTDGQTRAVLTYNHSTAYLASVLNLEHIYAAGHRDLVIPEAPATTPTVSVRRRGDAPVPPPADPGAPLAVTHPSRPAGRGTAGERPSGHPTASQTRTPAPTPSVAPGPTSSTPSTTAPSTTSSPSSPAPSSSTASPPPTCTLPTPSATTSGTESASGSANDPSSATPSASSTPSGPESPSSCR